jgi:hypothetical protein
MSCACRSMRRAGKWTRPDDRQAAKAARFRLTPSPGGGVVCLRNGDQRWRTLRGASCRSGTTAEGSGEGRSHPHCLRRRLH